MQFALHNPESGYYARRIRGVGIKGDFTTVPMLTNTQGRAVADWLLSESRLTGIRNLVEIGPGEGRLFQTVYQMIPFLKRRRFRFHLVETSKPLNEIQESTLGARCRWHTHPSEAMEACEGRALIFSNELVDAFPVRRFEKAEDGWMELGVRISGGRVVEELLLGVNQLPDSSVFSLPHPIGQRVEVHQSYQEWMSSWLEDWCQGSMLTIDYGDEVDKLYHRRPQGTVRAYLLQQRLEGPDIYQNVGRQDLTSDVNFTDLLKWSSGRLESLPLQNLREFCGDTNIALMQEQFSAGDAFRVLRQRRKPAGDS